MTQVAETIIWQVLSVLAASCPLPTLLGHSQQRLESYGSLTAPGRDLRDLILQNRGIRMIARRLWVLSVPQISQCSRCL